MFVRYVIADDLHLSIIVFITKRKRLSFNFYLLAITRFRPEICISVLPSRSLRWLLSSPKNRSIAEARDCLGKPRRPQKLLPSVRCLSCRRSLSIQFLLIAEKCAFSSMDAKKNLPRALASASVTVAMFVSSDSIVIPTLARRSVKHFAVKQLTE